MSGVPEVRFNEFEEAWEKLKLSDVLRVKGQRNRNGSFGRDHVLSVSGDSGVVNQIAHLGRSYAGVEVDGYHVVERGDVVYTKSPLKKNPFGIIKVNLGDPGIVSTLYAVYEVKDGHSPEFVNRYFEADDRTNAYLAPLVNKGAKNDMKISNERVLIDPVRFPKLPEQRQIAAFLSAVDARIALAGRERAGLGRFKAGLLQTLFSRTLRFTPEGGGAFPDWEELELHEIADRVTTRNRGRASTRVLTNSATRGVIDQGDYFEHDIANADNTDSYVVCRVGDFVYNPRMSVSAPVGPINRNDLGDGIMSPLYTVFRPHNSDTEFLAQYFKTSFWHDHLLSVANTGVRHDRLALTVEAFMSLPVPVPHPDEQARIAAALGALNARLDLAAREEAGLRRFKAGLLQAMFA